MKIVVLQLILFTIYWSNSFGDVSKFNPQAKQISGVNYPRTSLLKYRGMDDRHFSLQNAIHAMLGIDDKGLESKVITYYREHLMHGMSSNFDTHSEFQLKATNRGYVQTLHILKSENPKLITSYAEATKLAVSALSKSFWTTFNDSTIKQTFLDYSKKSNGYDDWPIEMIYTTIYPEVANIYGQNLVILDDSNAVDSNYWNLVNNGKWVMTARPWVDKGEFLHEFLVPQSSIVGYQLRDSKVPDWQTFRVLPSDLNLSFHKIKYQNKNFVLVFDGRNSKYQHIFKSGNTYSYGVTKYTDQNIEIPPFVEAKEPANLLGIIVECKNNSNCSPDGELYKDFQQKSKRLLSLAEFNFLNSNLSKDLKFFYSPTSHRIDDRKIFGFPGQKTEEGEKYNLVGNFNDAFPISMDFANIINFEKECSTLISNYNLNSFQGSVFLDGKNIRNVNVSHSNSKELCKEIQLSLTEQAFKEQLSKFTKGKNNISINVSHININTDVEIALESVSTLNCDQSWKDFSNAEELILSLNYNNKYKKVIKTNMANLCASLVSYAQYVHTQTKIIKELIGKPKKKYQVEFQIQSSETWIIETDELAIFNQECSLIENDLKKNMENIDVYHNKQLKDNYKGDSYQLVNSKICGFLTSRFKYLDSISTGIAKNPIELHTPLFTLYLDKLKITTEGCLNDLNLLTPFRNVKLTHAAYSDLDLIDQLDFTNTKKSCESLVEIVSIINDYEKNKDKLDQYNVIISNNDKYLFYGSYSNASNFKELCEARLSTANSNYIISNVKINNIDVSSSFVRKENICQSIAEFNQLASFTDSVVLDHGEIQVNVFVNHKKSHLADKNLTFNFTLNAFNNFLTTLSDNKLTESFIVKLDISNPNYQFSFQVSNNVKSQVAMIQDLVKLSGQFINKKLLANFVLINENIKVTNYKFEEYDDAFLQSVARVSNDKLCQSQIKINDLLYTTFDSLKSNVEDVKFCSYLSTLSFLNAYNKFLATNPQDSLLFNGQLLKLDREKFNCSNLFKNLQLEDFFRKSNGDAKSLKFILSYMSGAKNKKSNIVLKSNDFNSENICAKVDTILSKVLP